jgi:hypothetical protein
MKCLQPGHLAQRRLDFWIASQRMSIEGFRGIVLSGWSDRSADGSPKLHRHRFSCMKVGLNAHLWTDNPIRMQINIYPKAPSRSITKKQSYAQISVCGRAGKLCSNRQVSSSCAVGRIELTPASHASFGVKKLRHLKMISRYT